MKVEYQTYTGLTMSCKKISNNGGNIRKDEVEFGGAIMKPTKYKPFFVGTLRTNLVIKILEDYGTYGKFLTYSGSIYEWKVISKSYSEDTVVTTDIDDDLVELVDEMLMKYDNINKLINKI